MPLKRAETAVEGCLLQAEVKYPQRNVMLCKFCPNRSDDKGDLADWCHIDTKEK